MALMVPDPGSEHGSASQPRVCVGTCVGVCMRAWVCRHVCACVWACVQCGSVGRGGASFAGMGEREET